MQARLRFLQGMLVEDEYFAWRSIFYPCSTCSSPLNKSTHTVQGEIHASTKTHIHAHITDFKNTVVVPPRRPFGKISYFLPPPPRLLWVPSPPPPPLLPPRSLLFLLSLSLSFHKCLFLFLGIRRQAGSLTMTRVSFMCSPCKNRISVLMDALRSFQLPAS